MKAPREADVLRGCLLLLRLRGILAFRVNSGGVAWEHRGKRRFVRFVRGVDGISDIVGVLPAGKAAPAGRFLAVETKRPGGTPTPKQAAFLEAVRAAGGLALCVDDVRRLEEALDREGIKP